MIDKTYEAHKEHLGHKNGNLKALDKARKINTVLESQQ